MTGSSKRWIIAAVLGVFLISVVMVLPAFIRARSTPATNACVNNLRQIEGAKEQWSLEYNKTTNDIPSWDDIRPYYGRETRGELLQCPQGGTYTLGRVGQEPTCSIGGFHSLPR